MSVPIIEVDHVTKEFQLGKWQSIANSVRRIRGRLRGVAPTSPFRALDDVTLSIAPGEVVGIVGHNGAGKSTLLKLLSGITVPTRGKVTVRGRVAPLIEVGAGLIGVMTGRENIYLNGAILGMSKAEIARKFDEIVAFADLAQFIDTPLKRYSSGMQIRLGFSVATSVDAPILLIDEVLAVGDVAFQRKCLDRVDRLVSAGDRTILIVGHNIRQIERLCSRVLMLDRGRIVMDGKPADVCGAFLEATQAKVNAQQLERLGRVAAEVVTGHLHVTGVQVDVRQEPPGGRPNAPRSALDVRFGIEALERLDDVELVVGVHTPDLLFVTEMTSLRQGFRPTLEQGRQTLRCRFEDISLRPGVYGIGFAVYDHGGRCLWRANNLSPFAVEPAGVAVGASPTRGLVDTRCDWALRREPGTADAVAAGDATRARARQ